LTKLFSCATTALFTWCLQAFCAHCTGSYIYVPSDNLSRGYSPTSYAYFMWFLEPIPPFHNNTHDTLSSSPLPTLPSPPVPSPSVPPPTTYPTSPPKPPNQPPYKNTHTPHQTPRNRKITILHKPHKPRLPHLFLPRHFRFPNCFFTIVFLFMFSGFASYSFVI
jgi:hypothetical protein